VEGISRLTRKRQDDPESVGPRGSETWRTGSMSARRDMIGSPSDAVGHAERSPALMVTSIWHHDRHQTDIRCILARLEWVAL